ncbi:MAG: dihydroxyacetone kinase subunit L, partial [Bacteroidota bacterium]
RNDLIKAVETISQHISRQYEALNQLDGKLGDGDIGITMKTGFQAALERSPDWPEDLGMALMGFAKSFVENRASSYGTILSTGLMAAAIYCKGKTELYTTDIPPILSTALDKMAQRGKSELGQKTVLDAIYAAKIASETCEATSFEELGIAIHQKVQEAVEEYTAKPNLQGRARIFGDKSIGIPDPGMQVFLEMILAVTSK